MEVMIIRGIYKQNSRGRAYLIAYDATRKRHIYRVNSCLNAQNGATLNVIGEVRGKRISVHKYYPCVFSRHLSAHGRAA